MLTYFIAAAAFALIIFLLNLYIKFKSLENKNSEIKARKIRSENAQKKRKKINKYVQNIKRR